MSQRRARIEAASQPSRPIRTEAVGTQVSFTLRRAGRQRKSSETQLSLSATLAVCTRTMLPLCSIRHLGSSLQALSPTTDSSGGQASPSTTGGNDSSPLPSKGQGCAGTSLALRSPVITLVVMATL
eukprot:686344-Rhodomonas_salina.2